MKCKFVISSIILGSFVLANARLVSFPSFETAPSRDGKITRRLNGFSNVLIAEDSANLKSLDDGDGSVRPSVGDEFEASDVFMSPNALYGNILEDGTSVETINPNASLIAPLASDPNENNDSFESASAVYAVGQDPGHYGNWVRWGATINQKTSGVWPFQKKYVDKDFYSFDVTVTGTLNVKLLDIPRGCNYDMRLYKQRNSKSNTLDQMDFDKYLSISDNKGNADEEINYSVTPGTYYIAVYSYQDETWSDENYYIEFKQVQTFTSARPQSYNIASGRASGDLGAVWKSDYDPLGITPTLLKVDGAKYRFSSYGSYPYIRHLFERYRGQDKDIEYARVYVWDVGVRATLFAVAQELLNQVDAALKGKENQTLVVNMIVNGDSIALGIGSVALSIASIYMTATMAIATLGIGLAITSLIVSIAATCLSALFNASYTAKLRDFKEYLINLKAAMEVNRGSTNREVVMMRYRYRFGSDSGNPKRYIDYHPTYRITDTNLYNGTDISYISDESPINGTVKGFKNLNQLQRYLG